MSSSTARGASCLRTPHHRGAPAGPECVCVPLSATFCSVYSSPYSSRRRATTVKVTAWEAMPASMLTNAKRRVGLAASAAMKVRAYRRMWMPAAYWSGLA